jgi:hypothetical protein
MTTPALLPTSGGRKPQPPAAPYLAPGEQLVRVGASPTGHRGVWRGRRGWRAECGNGERAVITSEPPFLCAAAGCFPLSTVSSGAGDGTSPLTPAHGDGSLAGAGGHRTDEPTNPAQVLERRGELPRSVQRANREQPTACRWSAGSPGGEGLSGAVPHSVAPSLPREPKQEEAAQRR